MGIIRNFSIAIIIYMLIVFLFGFFKEIYRVFKENMEIRKLKKEIMYIVNEKLKKEFKEVKI